MVYFLQIFVIVMFLVVGLGFFNERVTKLTYEIALMLFAVIVGSLLVMIKSTVDDGTASDVLRDIQMVNLESFLMDGVLCFMLFAGSCHMRLYSFKEMARQITVLSIICTLLGAIFYGVLFYIGASILGIGFSLPVSLMFGSIVAPTDPIAATSILNKFGLPEKISFLIEGESLLNDGVGVALFVSFSGMVTATDGGGFFSIMARELFGAVFVGVLVTAICFPVFYMTRDENRRIFTSLLAVAAAYVFCDHFDFSGAIASVVCGVLFSSLRGYWEEHGHAMELEAYDSFWGVLDNMLNSVLYVLMGLSFVKILSMKHLVIISILAIICNLLARGGSLLASTLVIGTIPDGYDRFSFTKLLTWGGLRGGLCIALAMSTVDMIDKRTYYIILGCTYAIVMFTTIVQGLTMKTVYARIDAALQKNTKRT